MMPDKERRENWHFSASRTPDSAPRRAAPHRRLKKSDNAEKMEAYLLVFDVFKSGGKKKLEAIRKEPQH